MASLSVTPGVLNLIPETTLQRLSPRREGVWFVTGQAADHFTLAYVMDGGTHALTYHMYPCNTEEEVVEVCGHLMYTYSGYPVPLSRGTFPRRFETGSHPLHLVLRPRQEDTQGQSNIVHNLAGIDMSPNSIQGQVSAAPQPDVTTRSHDHVGAVAQSSLQDAEYQVTQSPANGQGQQQMINTAGGNGNMEWVMANDLFDTIAPIANVQNNNAFDTLSGENTMFGSVFNEYSPSAGDRLLSNGDNEDQLDWNMFTNN